jgi:hypothetical protein
MLAGEGGSFPKRPVAAQSWVANGIWK